MSLAQSRLDEPHQATSPALIESISPLSEDILIMQAPGKPAPYRAFRPSPSRPQAHPSPLGWLYPPAGLLPALVDAIAWLGISVVMRLAVEYGLASVPSFGLVAALVVSMPALLALGVSTVRPQLNSILVYRLLLVMFGLLLGGKL